MDAKFKKNSLTAEQWATRKGLGKKIIKHCHVYAIRAEIRMGELLAATERAKRGPDKIGGQRSQRITPDSEPTLADLGITKNESTQAQKLFKAPEDIKEKLLREEDIEKINRENEALLEYVKGGRQTYEEGTGPRDICSRDDIARYFEDKEND